MPLTGLAVVVKLSSFSPASSPPGPKSSDSVLGRPLRSGTGETVVVYVADVNAGLNVCMWLPLPEASSTVSLPAGMSAPFAPSS
jgi:hypothetical protein